MTSARLRLLLSISLALNLTMVGAAVALWSGPGTASPPPVESKASHHPLLFDEERLGLTPEQSGAFAQLRNEWDATYLEDHKRLNEILLQLYAVTLNEEADESELDHVLGVMRQRSDRSCRKLVDIIRRHRDVLSYEQNREFTLLLQEHFDELNGAVERRNKACNRKLEDIDCSESKPD